MMGYRCLWQFNSIGKVVLEANPQWDIIQLSTWIPNADVWDRREYERLNLYCRDSDPFPSVAYCITRAHARKLVSVFEPHEAVSALLSIGDMLKVDSSRCYVVYPPLFPPFEAHLGANQPHLDFLYGMQLADLHVMRQLNARKKLKVILLPANSSDEQPFADETAVRLLLAELIGKSTSFYQALLHYYEGVVIGPPGSKIREHGKFPDHLFIQVKLLSDLNRDPSLSTSAVDLLIGSSHGGNPIYPLFPVNLRAMVTLKSFVDSSSNFHEHASTIATLDAVSDAVTHVVLVDLSCIESESCLIRLFNDLETANSLAIVRVNSVNETRLSDIQSSSLRVIDLPPEMRSFALFNYCSACVVDKRCFLVELLHGTPIPCLSVSRSSSDWPEPAVMSQNLGRLLVQSSSQDRSPPRDLISETNVAVNLLIERKLRVEQVYEALFVGQDPLLVRYSQLSGIPWLKVWFEDVPIQPFSSLYMQHYAMLSPVNLFHCDSLSSLFFSEGSKERLEPVFIGWNCRFLVGNLSDISSSRVYKVKSMEEGRPDYICLPPDVSRDFVRSSKFVWSDENSAHAGMFQQLLKHLEPVLFSEAEALSSDVWSTLLCYVNERAAKIGSHVVFLYYRGRERVPTSAQDFTNITFLELPYYPNSAICTLSRGDSFLQPNIGLILEKMKVLHSYRALNVLHKLLGPSEIAHSSCPPPLDVVYINLKFRVDRKQEIEKVLLSAKFESIHRVDAVCIPTKGSLGCTLSHIKAIELAKENHWPRVLICEDDFQWRAPIGFNLERLKSLVEEVASSVRFDVLFLACEILIEEKVSDRRLVRVLRGATASGYIINHHYYDRLLENFRESARLHAVDSAEGVRGEHTLDRHWQQLQCTDYWLAFSPPIGHQRRSFSNIEGEYT